jgi:peptidoglycan hydrolase-like protein with peptidoglycan-binding domain
MVTLEDVNTARMEVADVDRRNSAYVCWLQAALNTVASARLAVDGRMGARTTAAVRSFQSSRGLVADGVVGARTERALVAAGAPAPPRGGPAPGPGHHPEVNTVLPTPGSGYRSYKPSSNQYGISETIRAIQAIGATWNGRHPGGPRISIGDISLRGGGPMPGHASHQRGVDFDVRPMRSDGREDPVTYKSVEYSRPLTQELVDQIRSNGVLKVQYIFFNDSAVVGVRHWPNHDDHLHVRFFPPGGAASGKPAVPAPRPTPPPGPASPGTLLKREAKPPLSTLYLDIKLGSEQPAKAMTGVFIPERYRPEANRSGLSRVDLLLWLHGFKRKQPRLTIDAYWNAMLNPQRAFREGVNDSHKSLVLVAPTLGPKSEAGRLVQPGGLDAYLSRVMAALAKEGPWANSGARPYVGDIILACHSGGGLPMRMLAVGGGKYASAVRECWGFDCLYNQGDANIWAKWARQHPQAKLHVHYQKTTTTQSELLQTQALPNVSVERSHARGHEWVPITHWAERIEQAGFLRQL